MGFFPSFYEKKRKSMEFSLSIFCFLWCICFLSGHEWSPSNRNINLLSESACSKKKKKNITHFTGNFTASHPLRRCSNKRAWNEIWLNVFDALSLIRVLGDFISVAVSEGAVSLSLVEWFKVAEWTCRLTGWDSSSPSQASPDIHPSWFAFRALLPKHGEAAGWETAAWTGPLQTAERPPFTNIFL